MITFCLSIAVSLTSTSYSSNSSVELRWIPADSGALFSLFKAEYLIIILECPRSYFILIETINFFGNN